MILVINICIYNSSIKLKSIMPLYCLVIKGHFSCHVKITAYIIITYIKQFRDVSIPMM